MCRGHGKYIKHLREKMLGLRVREAQIGGENKNGVCRKGYIVQDSTKQSTRNRGDGVRRKKKTLAHESGGIQKQA